MKRMTMFRTAVLVVTLAASVLVASALAGGTKQAAGPSGTVTLAGWASSPAETELLQQVIANFEKKFPSIKVNYAPINGDYPTAMLAKFAARTPPDVFYVDSNVAPDWIRQGLLQPLDSYVKQSKFNTAAFFPSLLSAFKSGGQTYGFPKDWSPLAMETSNGLLGKAGVKKAPQTWAQLTAAAAKLKSSGVVGDGAPICLSPDWARMLAFVYQNNGSFLNAGKTAATVTSPATVAAVNYYVGLIKSGVAKTPAQLGVGWCGEALGKGKSAIIFEGNWVVPYMHDTFPGIAYGISPMVSGKTGGNLAFTVSYSMAKDSQNKPAAWTLIQYLTGKEGMATWTSKGLALPSRSDVKPLGGRQAFIGAAKFSHPWQFAPTFSKVIDTANNELTAVFAGSESVDTMLTKIRDVANSALKG